MAWLTVVHLGEVPLLGYIRELRDLVGTRPLLMPGAGVLVLDADGKLLMCRRRDNGAWAIPGGMMEPGESLEETARREVEEETGLRPAELVLFGVFSGPELYYRYPNGDEVYNVTVAYVCTRFHGTLRADGHEVTEVGWFPAHSLPAPLSPPVKPIILRFTGGAIEAGTVPK